MADTVISPKSVVLPRFVRHESFAESRAAATYDPALAANPDDFEATYMPDDVTRDIVRRMHYAAYRCDKARTERDRQHWRQIYFDLRDRAVVGNRKLVYRAVRKQMSMSNRADDLIGDCHIVLIQAVAAYDPWFGVRFSTYAFTCLLRALARKAQRAAHDWLSKSIPLDALPDGEPGQRFEPELSSSSHFQIDEYLRDDHPLLSVREKRIISRRFGPAEGMPAPTLEIVGREMGLSKERVRQVQAAALGKLRRVLLGEAEPVAV